MQKLRTLRVKPCKGGWCVYVGTTRYSDTWRTQLLAIQAAERDARGNAYIRIYNKAGQLRRVYRILEVSYTNRWDIPKDKW